MSHFADQYLERVNTILHMVLAPTWFYKQELIEVPGLLTAMFITYDGMRDDSREIVQWSWEQFQQRMLAIDPDWNVDQDFLMEVEKKKPEFGMGGWQRRTIYLIRAGNRPEYWTANSAAEDMVSLMNATVLMTGRVIQQETEHLREFVPPGAATFQAFEHIVRVVFNFLFIGELGEGKAQSRTEPENEGLEIRDLIFSNNAKAGFWNDLKQKYSASEIVVDAKNKDELTRDDLRQLYCYLKPALGFWGFIVCRSEQSATIIGFNRTLFRNFNQSRGLLILSDDDLRRMVQLKMRAQDPATYLQERMSVFVRSI